MLYLRNIEERYSSSFLLKLTRLNLKKKKRPNQQKQNPTKDLLRGKSRFKNFKTPDSNIKQV